MATAPSVSIRRSRRPTESGMRLMVMPVPVTMIVPLRRGRRRRRDGLAGLLRLAGRVVRLGLLRLTRRATARSLLGLAGRDVRSGLLGLTRRKAVLLGETRRNRGRRLRSGGLPRR